MRATILLLAFCLAAVTALPKTRQRIVGGSVTTIEQYPYGAALLVAWADVSFSQSCGGTIINNRSVLTAAHCVYQDPPRRWRIRVGSTWPNSGGTVYNTAQIIVHPKLNSSTHDNDIAILRTSSAIMFSNSVSAASIAGSNYNLDDGQNVWAIGWGSISMDGTPSEQLRHVQVQTINQAICRNRYMELNLKVTDNMLCSGVLDVGGRDQCSGDSGSPLLHNNVVVGVCSWGFMCAQPRYPGVNVRVSRFTSWIQWNA